MPDRYDDLDRAWDDRLFGAYARFTDRPVKTSIVWLATILGVVLALSLIGNALGIANVYWGAQRAQLTVKPRVTQYTYGTDNAVFNLAYFHSQCNTVVQDEQKVRNARATLKQDRATLKATTDPIAQQQAGSAVTQDVSTLQGTLGQLSNDVGDYNAKSATVTANPFKANNLPKRFTVKGNGELRGSQTCH